MQCALPGQLPQGWFPLTSRHAFSRLKSEAFRETDNLVGQLLSSWPKII